MHPNYLKSIRRARLRCQPFQNPDWPLLDDNGDPILGADGQPCCTYYVRILSVADTIALLDAKEKLNEHDAWWEILSRTLCDEHGQLILSPEDRSHLEAKGHPSILLAVQTAMQVNGLGDSAKNS